MDLSDLDTPKSLCCSIPEQSEVATKGLSVSKNFVSVGQCVLEQRKAIATMHSNC